MQQESVTHIHPTHAHYNTYTVIFNLEVNFQFRQQTSITFHQAAPVIGIQRTKVQHDLQ
jgi:hypothetical protein